MNNLTYGDCTCFECQEIEWKKQYICKQYGIHLHCTKHPEQELTNIKDDLGEMMLKCPICSEYIAVENIQKIIQDCLKLLNSEKFKGAKLIRLDDWYTPEIKKKIKDERISDYWIETNVKTDKDGDTIIIIYVGKKDSKDKCQFFIKPEKLQLSTDHKDLDPAEVLSKIEVKLKGRTLKQEYDN